MPCCAPALRGALLNFLAAWSLLESALYHCFVVVQIVLVRRPLVDKVVLIVLCGTGECSLVGDRLACD